MLEQILTPTVLLGIIAVVLIGTGIGIMSVSPPEYTGARICFGTAWFLIVGYLFWWVTTAETTGTDIVTSFLVVLGISVLWTIADKWVVTRKANDPDAQRRVHLGILTGYVMEGIQLCQTYESPEIISVTVKDEWEDKVFNYLEKNFGRPFAIQFVRHDTTRPTSYRCPPNIPTENYVRAEVIKIRLAQLDEIIKVLMR